MGRRDLGVTVKGETDASAFRGTPTDLPVCGLGETTLPASPKIVVDVRHGVGGDFGSAKSVALNLKPWEIGSLEGADDKVEFDNEAFSRGEATRVLGIFAGVGFPTNPNLLDKIGRASCRERV